MFNKPNLRNQLSKNLINIVGLTAGVVIGCPVLAQTNSPANSGIISCPSVANPTTTGTGTTSSLNNTTGAGNLGATASGGNTIVNSPLGSPSSLITPPVSGLNTTTAGTGTTSSLVSPANAGFSTPNLNRTSTIGSLGTTNSTVLAACPAGVTPTNTQR